MGKLIINANIEGEKLMLDLTGQIDENADFANVDLNKSKEVLIDMKNVNAINSCGVREWIKWISTAQKTQRIGFRACPRIIIDQINKIDGFLPLNGAVDSFFVPYFSPETGEERNVLFSKGKEFQNGEVTPPGNIVSREGRPMEMDIIESKYFKFLIK